MSVKANGATIVPSTPTYQLLLGGEVVDSGSMTVGDTDLSVMVEPPRTGAYTLEVTFGVGLEIIVRKVSILVLN